MNHTGNQSLGICGCGKTLFPSYDEKGVRTGVTHQGEDDDHHLNFYAGMRVELE